MDGAPEGAATQAQSLGMDLDTDLLWELRRPDLLLQALGALHPFNRPCALLARVDGPYDDQALTAATVLWEEPPCEQHELARRTEEALARLGCGWSDAPYAARPLVVPVVVRPGSSWWSPDETDVVLGLRYGSNLSDVRQGNLLTVTSRGWHCQGEALGGEWPRTGWSDFLHHPH